MEELQQLQSRAYEDPYTPNTDLIIFLVAGSVLTFVGTPAFYIWFAATERAKYTHKRDPLPVVSDMFTHWPVLSSFCMGVGTALLFTGIIATAIARIPLDLRF
jgi:hypothetical protein